MGGDQHYWVFILKQTPRPGDPGVLTWNEGESCARNGAVPLLAPPYLRGFCSVNIVASPHLSSPRAVPALSAAAGKNEDSALLASVLCESLTLTYSTRGIRAYYRQKL